MRVSAVTLTAALGFIQTSKIKAFSPRCPIGVNPKTYDNHASEPQPSSVAFARSKSIPQFTSRMLKMATTKGSTEADSVPSVLKRLPGSSVEVVITVSLLFCCVQLAVVFVTLFKHGALHFIYVIYLILYITIRLLELKPNHLMTVQPTSFLVL